MEFVRFEEKGQYNWQIEYFIAGEPPQIIAKGCYDFVPRINEAIILNDIVYLVCSVMYDFDTETIYVELKTINA